MNINAVQVEKDFWGRFERLVNTIALGRKVEILLRVCTDTEARAGAWGDLSFDDSQNTPMHHIFEEASSYARKNFGGLIGESMPVSDAKELDLIKDIAGALSHAQIHDAKKRVDKYLEHHQAKNKINNDLVPGVLFTNVQDEPGKKYYVTYHPDFSRHNTKMQEWQVFECRGYATICEELFEKATRMVRGRFSNAAYREVIAGIFMAMKKGEKHFGA